MKLCGVPIELVAGGTVGVVFAELVRWLLRPRAQFIRLESKPDVQGLTGGIQSLHRMRFKVRGAASGEAAAILSKWGPSIDQATYAKWDESPEPFAWDSGSQVLELNLVPQTFYLPLFASRTCPLPILVNWKTGDVTGLDIFCGWWYLRWREERNPLRVTLDDTISIQI